MLADGCAEFEQGSVERFTSFKLAKLPAEKRKKCEPAALTIASFAVEVVVI